jgi:DNA-binding transcriptional ArsR family regulator
MEERDQDYYIDRGFKGVWIPLEIFFSDKISPLEKILWADIHFLDKDGQGCYVSNDVFSKKYGISPINVSKHIRKLKELGFVEQIRFDGRKRFLKSCLINPDNPPLSTSITPPYRNRQPSNIIENNKENKREYIYSKNGYFEQIWKKYPSRAGKKAAFKHFQRTVKTKEDWDNINKALDNYLSSRRVNQGYIQNGSTWFNQWEDWINWIDEASYDPLVAKGIIKPST